MARPTLAQVASLQAATTYRWDVAFSGAPVVLYGMDDGINLRCQTLSMPTKTNEPLERTVRGHKFYEPGISDPSGDITFTMYETTDGKVLESLQLWADAEWLPNLGTQADNTALMAGLTISLLDRRDNTTRVFQLENCFLTEVSIPDLDSENASLQPTFTVKYSGWASFRV